MRSLPWNAVYRIFLHSSWMLTDKLKLNDDKTEFMLIGTKQQLSKINIGSVTVGSIDVAPVTVARNLGTWFDSNLNLQEQIHKTFKSGFFHLYNIRRIRKYLSQESTRTLVHAFIIGRIDYCNSLLFGLPSVHLLKLQRLQNAAARLISNVPRYSHITPVLWSLHWLLVKFRIDFIILLLTFKPIYGHAPGYSIDLIAIKEQPRDNFRSASGLILKYPGLKLEKTFGDRAFSSASSNLWNNLPFDIRFVDNFERFKSLLQGFESLRRRHLKRKGRAVLDAMGNARGAQGNCPVVLATSLGSHSYYVGRECSNCSTGSVALEFGHFELFFLYAPIKEFWQNLRKKFCFKLFLFK